MINNTVKGRALAKVLVLTQGVLIKCPCVPGKTELPGRDVNSQKVIEIGMR